MKPPKFKRKLLELNWKKIALQLATSIVNFENDNSADRFPEEILKLSQSITGKKIVQ
jgi:hypothetical protein